MPVNDDENLTRFEVIDHRGPAENHRRAMVVGPSEEVRIRVLEQDEGRTLKVILSDRVSKSSSSIDGVVRSEKSGMLISGADDLLTDAAAEAVLRFRDAVASFLAWVDEGGKPDSLIRILSSLVHLGFELPQVEPEVPDIEDLRAQVKYSHVQGIVAERLEGDVYWVVSDPFNLSVEKAETTLGMISDDIVDIYLDLAHGELIAERGSLIDAIWHWRLSFETHWGRHASDAFNALYRLYR